MPVRGSVVLVRRSFLRSLKMARVASSLLRKKVPLSPASYCWPFFSEKSALVALSEMSWVTGSAAGKTSKFFGRKIFEIGNSRRTGRDDFGGAGKQGPRWAAGGVGATKGAGKAPSWSAASSESGRNEGLDFSAGPRVGAFFCDPGAV